MWPPPDLPYELVVWPVSAVLGCAAGLNAQVTLGIVTASVGFYAMARRWVRSRWLTLGGGLLFGFSPYITSEVIVGHTYLVEAGAIPLLFLAVHEVLVRQHWSPMRAGLFLGSTALVQLLTSEELLFDSVVLLAVGVVLLCLFTHEITKERLAYIASSLIYALPFAVVAVPFLGYQFLGPGALHGNLVPAAYWEATAVSLFLPGAQQALTLPTVAHLVWLWSFGAPELASYFGIPLTITLGLLMLRFRDETIAWLACMATVAMICSMGAVLDVTSRLPIRLLNNDLPARYSLFTDLFGILLLGILLDRLASVRPWLAAGLLVLVAASWVPLLSVPYSTPPTPPFFQTAHDEQSISPGSTVLVLPYAYGPSTDLAMFWQARAHFRFRMPEGYFTGNSIKDDSYDRPSEAPFVLSLVAADNGEAAAGSLAQIRSAARIFLRSQDVSWVVVGPSRYEDLQVRFTRKVLRERGRSVGGVVLFHIG